MPRNDGVREFRTGRRRFLQAGLTAAALPYLLEASRLNAAEKQIVLAMWDGEAVDVYREAYVEPFAAATGTRVELGSEDPTPGRIKSMVESRSVSWDVCGQGIAGGNLWKQGLLTPIDYGVIDKSNILDGMAYEWGSTGFVFSSVIAFNRNVFHNHPPMTWADFWDVETFPGKRSLWKRMEGVLEAALLADGVAPEAIYPLDLDRALGKILALKDHLVMWDTGADSQQLFRDGEVTVGQIWNTRAQLLWHETEGEIDYHWNQGILQPGTFVVPKGNPAGDLAMTLIAAMQNPESQLILLRKLGLGPANPKTASLYTPQLAGISPSFSENLSQQFIARPDWYADHYDEAMARFTETTSA
jgi:putative spermidine/putrescine transport system substrate-binding protein